MESGVGVMLLRSHNMNKTLEALLLGYVEFRVNDKAYLTYNGANKACEGASNVHLKGLHFYKGWRSFLIRMEIT